MQPLTIGELGERSGLAPSALRFYESQGLLPAERTPGGQRRYPRSALRRVAFIRAAQRVGLSLGEVREALGGLPDSRTPSLADWRRLSSRWQSRLDERIVELERLRDSLTSCIGCGCLPLRRCALYNPGDRAAALGSGARYLAADLPDDDERAAAPPADRDEGGAPAAP